MGTMIVDMIMGTCVERYAVVGILCKRFYRTMIWELVCNWEKTYVVVGLCINFSPYREQGPLTAQYNFVPSRHRLTNAKSRL